MSRLISFVIPCYGSENTLEGVVEEIRTLMKAHIEDSYEIILVNDSSPDHVWDVIEKLANENDDVIGIDLARNFGQHAALLAGYRQVKGDLIVSLDDDGQIAVEDTYKLIEHLNAGFDVVYGRYKVKQHNWFRNLGSKIAGWMSVHLIGTPKSFSGSSFYVARRYIIDEMSRYPNAYVYLMGLVFRTTDKIDSVYVGHRKREVGQSGYSFGKLLGLWLNGATTFSIKPLRLSALFGFIVAVVGFICSVAVTVKKLVHPEMIMGWSSMMAATLMLSGVILIVLGVLGEYVGRLYMSSSREPQYVVRRIVCSDDKSDI